MATAPNLATSDLDRLLTTLGREYALGALGEARFVVGPAGGFIVQVLGDNLERDTYELVKLTNATRIALSDHLPWVPFLDPLLVAPETVGHHRDVTVVPADLVLDVLRDGHQRLDETTMDRIFVLLAEHRLDPAWTLIGWPDGTLGTCNESGPPTASSWPSTTSAVMDLPYS